MECQDLDVNPKTGRVRVEMLLQQLGAGEQSGGFAHEMRLSRMVHREETLARAGRPAHQVMAWLLKPLQEELLVDS
ncbi:hypothetical protein GCM10018953_17840 [Streptosporangium nondiastaticum]